MNFYGKAEDAFKSLSSELKHSEPEELFCNSELLKRQLLILVWLSLELRLSFLSHQRSRDVKKRYK